MSADRRNAATRFGSNVPSGAKNVKWGPWKLFKKDTHYSPVVVEKWEREGEYDYQEFTEMPAFEDKYKVISPDGSVLEFDNVSESDRKAKELAKQSKR
jgi:hypothetical protein